MKSFTEFMTEQKTNARLKNPDNNRLLAHAKRDGASGSVLASLAQVLRKIEAGQDNRDAINSVFSGPAASKGARKDVEARLKNAGMDT